MVKSLEVWHRNSNLSTNPFRFAYFIFLDKYKYHYSYKNPLKYRLLWKKQLFFLYLISGNFSTKGKTPETWTESSLSRYPLYYLTNWLQGNFTRIIETQNRDSSRNYFDLAMKQVFKVIITVHLIRSLIHLYKG